MAIFIALNPEAVATAAPAARAAGKHAGGRPRKDSAGNSATVAGFSRQTAEATEARLALKLREAKAWLSRCDG